jgi:hypothetical protein
MSRTTFGAASSHRGTGRPRPGVVRLLAWPGARNRTGHVPFQQTVATQKLSLPDTRPVSPVNFDADPVSYDYSPGPEQEIERVTSHASRPSQPSSCLCRTPESLAGQLRPRPRSANNGRHASYFPLIIITIITTIIVHLNFFIQCIEM